jgi:hypothetical protein
MLLLANSKDLGHFSAVKILFEIQGDLISSSLFSERASQLHTSMPPSWFGLF